MLACACSAPVAARAADPLELIPADALLAWSSRPLPEVSPPSDDEAPSPLTTLFDVGARIAGRPIEGRAQLALRAVELLGLVIRYEFALTILDARAKPLENDPDSRRVDQLRFALVVRTQGRSEPLRRVIQKVVNEQTDQSQATLARRKAQRWSYQELRDARLPEWCRIGWGQIEDCFVLTVGEEVWAQVADVAAGKSASLGGDRFVASGRSKRPDALIEVIVSVNGIRQRLDPFVQGRASEFFTAWRADDIDRAHWALGFEQRALYCTARFLKGDTTLERLYADPTIRDPRLLATIPDSARYAIYRVPAGQIMTRLFSSLYSTRGQDVRQTVDAEWARIQREHGFDAERDLLAHLGDTIVLHNDPPHPLRLPLAMTGLVEIRDEPAKVRKTLEAFCRAWQKALDQAGESDPGAPALHYDSDGVWYLQFGFVAGIAWTSTDRFIITSWSPTALRTYLAKVGQAVR